MSENHSYYTTTQDGEEILFGIYALKKTLETQKSSSKKSDYFNVKRFYLNSSIYFFAPFSENSHMPVNHLKHQLLSFKRTKSLLSVGFQRLLLEMIFTHYVTINSLMTEN